MRSIEFESSVAFAVVSAICIMWMLRQYHRWSSTSQKQSTRATFGHDLRKQHFCIDANVYQCNNGSFGAVPRPVLEKQQRLMEKRERNPELWYRNQYDPYLFSHEEAHNTNMYADGVDAVAAFVGSKRQDLVLVENVTTGTNAVLKSLSFQRGDKILITSHTYRPVKITVEFVSKRLALETVVLEIPIPIDSEDDIINLYSEVLKDDKDIKLAVVDHITGASAIKMPVKRIAALCHMNGVMVLVDGAHAPGQIPLNMEDLGVDFYCGNLHKWLFTPRGCAFLWVQPDYKDVISPVTTSYRQYDSNLMQRFCFLGTRDCIPYYLAETAIKFYNDLGGMEEIVTYNSTLSSWAADMISKALNAEKLQIPVGMRAPCMSLVAIPETSLYPACTETCHRLMSDVYKHSQVFVVFSYFNQRLWCRISSQVYNCKEDYTRLRDALLEVLQL
ncbi:L-cysteine desulfhydrase-like isoform X3 [Asterias rubens]|nr:L-cysteine desulfhydrase-like isoform X3 [Asterias rubens]